jgi:small subunit ribosomal protein S16
MVKIRLRRVGAKKQPHYRVVVTDSHAPRDGRFIETIGNYNPRTDPPTVEVDAERALYWLSVGAQPSAAVQRMLDKMGIMSMVTVVRQGEVSVEELAQQMRQAKAEAEAQPVKAEAQPEEEAEPSEGEEWPEEEEPFEAEGEELEPEADLADEDDWSESDEDEDTTFDEDYDLDAEEAEDIDEE